MKKQIWTKVLMWVLVAVTIVAVIFGVSRYIFGGFGTMKTVKETIVIDEQIEVIDVDMDMGDIKVVYGDEAAVKYEFSEKSVPKVTCKDGKLTVKQKKTRIFGRTELNNKYSLTIILPSGNELDSMTVEADMGSIKLSEIKVSGKVEIAADMGNIELNNINCKSMTAEADMGNIELKNLICEKLDAEADMGNIEVSGDFDEANVSCDMGNVSVDCDNEDAVINAECDMGECKVNGVKR